MKVWVGYDCYYNGCDEFRHVVKIFNDEFNALTWKEEFTETEWRWRDYVEFKVE